eukprot:gene21768-1250_t
MGGIKNFTMFIRKESCDQDRPIVSHVRLPSSSGCIPCNNRGTDICNCSPITGPCQPEDDENLCQRQAGWTGGTGGTGGTHGP